jgi:anti-sigma regulatory factor (Ser/Thr protein kinase)/biotin operon repressor
MSDITKDILDFAKKANHPIKTSEIVEKLGFSRQYINEKITDLVDRGKLIKIGSTRNAQYVTPEYAVKHLDIFPDKFVKVFQNKNLEEHKILDEIEAKLPSILKLNENVRSVFTYAFSEMLNNAIEHSQSDKIRIEINVKDDFLSFIVDDFGVGVYRNIMTKKKLKSEIEAIQDLLKGKTTTMPKSHSGEGIFFTSKVGDEFILDSYGYRLVINNKIKDLFLQEIKGKGKKKEGTKVFFKLSVDSTGHLNDVFRQYANIDDKSNYGFDKTKINIKLYTNGGVHISRSQARRVLSGLEKFRVIVFDFDKVDVIGQAFADEIFRVFHNKYPNIKLEAVNMNDAVKFMIDRVDDNNPRNHDVFLES